MRFLLTVIVGIFLATFAWGWVTHVYQGQMDTKSYTNYYLREMNDQIKFCTDEVMKLVNVAKKPLPARKSFEL